MGLIKAEATLSSRPAPFSMADIEKQAMAILLRARQKAARVLADAQRAGEDLSELAQAEGAATGHREGFAKGVEEGRAQGHSQALAEHSEQFVAAVQTLASAMEELNARRREFEEGVVREVIALSVRIAERVIKRYGVQDPSMLTDNVAEALKLVIGMHKLRIAIHPSQNQVLADALPRLKLEFPTLEHAEIVEDASLNPGGCRLLTRQGQIDADLDEQLQRIAADLVPE